MTKDLTNKTITKIALAPVSIATDTDTAGIIIDMDGAESGKLSLLTGIVTAGDVAIKDIQESADSGMSGATVIPDERLINKDTDAITTSNTVKQVGFIANYRYVQVTVTTDNSANLLAGVTIEQGDLNAAPED